MVLSNLSNNMDVESRTMATMGDTLGGSAAGLGAGAGSCCRAGHEARVPLRVRRLLFAFCPLGRSPLTEPVRVSSFARSLGRGALLLPHGPGRVWGLHQENHKARLDRLKPQVSSIGASGVCFP